MKRIITSAAIVMLICVASAWADPIPGNVPDVVVAHPTIQDQRETIGQDVRDTHQSIVENWTAGQENIQDQRQAMRTDGTDNREDVRDSLTT